MLRRSAPLAYVLGPYSSSAWTEARRQGQLATDLPYGAELAGEAGYRVQYFDDLGHERALALARRCLDHLPRLRGRGAAKSLLAGWQARRSDVLVAFFENEAGALAALWRLWPRLRPPRTVLVVCWLAQDIATLAPRKRTAWRRRLLAFDELVVFSSNQVPMLTAALELPDGRVRAVAFGVETTGVAEHDQPSGPVVSVGTDSRRDWRTLAQALGQAGLPAVIACPPDALAGTLLPDGVQHVGVVEYREYHQLLLNALCVVVCSVECAYPTGQSVLLESMARGKACVVTDSPALEDYVRHEVNALLVPAGDVEALSEALCRLARDSGLREALGRAGRQTYLEGLTAGHMWQQLLCPATDTD